MKKTLDLNLSGKDILIITDIQLDFLPGGALPIKEGDQIIPILNDYIKLFVSVKAKIVASRDWHPANHISFEAQGGPWPPHCVQGSVGAKFSPALKLPKDVTVVSKATDPNKEAYSVFTETGLEKQLKDTGIARIFVGGLATDYCVVNSVLDARKAGFDVVVLADATRGVDVTPGDVEKAFVTMKSAGAAQVTLADFPEPEDLAGDENPAEVVGDEPLGESDVKKKARMRPRGSYKQIRREKG